MRERTPLFTPSPGVFDGIDLTPKQAYDLYEAGVRVCSERGVSFDRLRVLYWALGGSSDGWLWDGVRWCDRVRLEARWHFDGKALVVLPQTSSIWLALSLDEAFEAGYQESEWQGRPNGDERVTVFAEKLYGIHLLNIENIPATSALEARAGGSRFGPSTRIFCQACDFAFGIGRGEINQVYLALNGLRGDPEEISLRLHQLRLRWMLPDSIPGETGAALTYLRRWQRQPQRETSPLACLRAPLRRLLGP